MPSPFVKLSDPPTYVACDWDLRADAGGRGHWVTFFKQHVLTILQLGVEAAIARGGDLGGAKARAHACKIAFDAHFDAFAAAPQHFASRAGETSPGPITILTLDCWRDQILRQHGFVDAFVDLKHRENEKMLPLLPIVCAQLDAIADPRQQLRVAIENVFAGNIFDMGAEATAKAFLSGSPDFFNIRAKLAPRPWLIDEYDALETRLLDGPLHKRCVYFIDNAGSDFLLGAMPLVRWLAKRDTSVVIAANERPTLNDMTIHDVREWWPRIVDVEPSLIDLPIELVSTGTGEPLIDLAIVSDELNAAAVDADFVILEGMGRGVESNLRAEFSCDTLNIAMLKDTAIASRAGGKVFDLVCRFR